jgi:predicted acylesterase/phospholipase RssA
MSEEDNYEITLNNTILVPTNIKLTKYNTLVLSGGHKKGIIQLGFLHFLYETNPNYISFKNYIGTSIGSINCLLLAVGYTPMEAFQQVFKADLNVTKNVNFLNLLTNFGLCSSDKIFNLIKDLVILKLNTIPSLEELYRLTGKNLICTTYNLTTHNTVYLNRLTHKDLSVIEAIKMSSNLPLIFEKYIYDKCYYIDGGISDNYSVRYSCSLINDDSDDYILGINVKTSKKEEETDNWNIFSYINQMTYIPLKKSDNSKFYHEKLHNISIFINDCKKDLDLNISSKDKLDMFAIGYAESLKIFGEKDEKNEKDENDKLINKIKSD